MIKRKLQLLNLTTVFLSSSAISWALYQRLFGLDLSALAQTLNDARLHTSPPSLPLSFIQVNASSCSELFAAFRKLHFNNRISAHKMYERDVNLWFS